MSRALALFTALFALACGIVPAHAATINFLGGHHDMGLVEIGQEGTINVNSSGFALGEVKGFLPGLSKITIDYTIAGNPVHSPSFGPFTRLVGGAAYNFVSGGSHYFGFSYDQDPPSGNMSRGWVNDGSGTTASTPLVMVTAGITDEKHGTITIVNYAQEKAFFVSLVQSFLRFGRVIGHYSVASALQAGPTDPLSTVPLPPSIAQLLMAMAGMLGFAAFRKGKAAA